MGWSNGGLFKKKKKRGAKQNAGGDTHNAVMNIKKQLEAFKRVSLTGFAAHFACFTHSEKLKQISFGISQDLSLILQ